MAKKRLITAFFFLFTLNVFQLFAQEIPEHALILLDSAQRELMIPAWKTLNGKTDEERTMANQVLSENLKETLSLPHSFEFPFDSLKTISILPSSDGTLRIFTWTMPRNDGTFLFHGLLQVLKNKDDDPMVFELIDVAHDSTHNLQNRQLGPDEWFGAHYYQLIDVKSKEGKYYTLVGWKGNNNITTKKVIDVLAFDENDQPYFGKPVFKMKNDELLYRIIYVFSAEVSMSIKYYDDTQTIIMDHLYPSDPRFEGHFEFYGPDLSFDALKMEKGNWLYIDDYDPGLRPSQKEIQLKEEKKIY